MKKGIVKDFALELGTEVVETDPTTSKLSNEGDSVETLMQECARLAAEENYAGTPFVEVNQAIQKKS
jgi:hypothetical protein